MQINKIKLALGLVAGAALAMPMVASAAADQEAAMKMQITGLTHVVNTTTKATAHLAQINKGNVKNLKAWLGHSLLV